MGFEVKSVGLEEARRHLGDLVSWVFYGNGIVSLTKNGKPVAALVPLEWIEQWTDDDQGRQGMTG